MAVIVRAIDIQEPRLLVSGQDNVVDLTVYVDGVATDATSMTLSVYDGTELLGSPTVSSASGKMTATITAAMISTENLFEVVNLAWQFTADGLIQRHPERAWITDVRALPTLTPSRLTSRFSMLLNSNNMPSNESNLAYIINHNWVSFIEILATLTTAGAHAAVRETWRANAWLEAKCLADIMLDHATRVPAYIDIYEILKDNADRQWAKLQVWIRKMSDTEFPESDGGHTIGARPYQRIASVDLDGGI